MEYDVWKAFMFFFCGALAYAFAVRVFKIYVKTLFYKITFINCLSALKFVDGISQKLINSCEDTSPEDTRKAFEHWRALSMLSLRSHLPDQVWRQLAIADWHSAMKLLSNLEEKGVLDEQA